MKNVEMSVEGTILTIKVDLSKMRTLRSRRSIGGSCVSWTNRKMTPAKNS
jgi:hypothetical protein